MRLCEGAHAALNLNLSPSLLSAIIDGSLNPGPDDAS